MLPQSLGVDSDANGANSISQPPDQTRQLALLRTRQQQCGDARRYNLRHRDNLFKRGDRVGIRRPSALLLNQVGEVDYDVKRDGNH